MADDNTNSGFFSKNKDLTNRILFTILILSVYRLGTYVPLSGIDPESLKTLMANFFGAFTQAGITGVAVLLTIIGAGAGAAAAGLSPIKLAGGMTAIGAGLAGFFLGILAAEGYAKIGNAAGLDGSNLKTLINNFVGAFQETSTAGLIAVGALLAVGATIGATLGAKGAVGVALGMTGIGAGFAGFFGGLMFADKFAETLGTDVPGAKLGTMMKNFFGAMNEADDKTLKAVGLLLVAGAAIGIALPGAGPAMVALGMTALGAGLAGFFGGLLLADVAISKLGGEDAGAGIATLLTNLGKGLGGFVGGFGESMAKQMENINADKMSKLGGGIKDLGVGILAFAGGQGVGAVTGIMGKIGSLFGSDSPLEQIADFSEKISDKNADKLAKLGQGIGGLGTGLLSLSQADPAAIEKNLAAISAASFAGMETKPFAAFPMKSMQEGGLVSKTGPILAHKDEIIFDQQASGMMVKAAQLMADSGAMNSAGLNGGGQPVIINNNNVDNSMQSNQTTAVSIPAPTRSNESTLRALQMA